MSIIGSRCCGQHVLALEPHVLFMLCSLSFLQDCARSILYRWLMAGVTFAGGGYGGGGGYGSQGGYGGGGYDSYGGGGYGGQGGWLSGFICALCLLHFVETFCCFSVLTFNYVKNLILHCYVGCRAGG